MKGSSHYLRCDPQQHADPPEEDHICANVSDAPQEEHDFERKESKASRQDCSAPAPPVGLQILMVGCHSVLPNWMRSAQRCFWKVKMEL